MLIEGIIIKYLQMNKTLKVAGLMMSITNAESVEEIYAKNWISMMQQEAKEIKQYPSDEQLEKEADQWVVDNTELMNENLTPEQRQRYEL